MKQTLTIILSCLLTGLPAQAASTSSIGPLLDKSYIALLSDAPKLNVTAEEAKPMEKLIQLDYQKTKVTLEAETKAQKKKIKDLQNKLDKLNQNEKNYDSPVQTEQRKEIHCSLLAAQKDYLTNQIALKAAQIVRDNKLAKLDLLIHWPSDYRTIQEDKKNGEAVHRRHGDIEDIGFRKGFEHQVRDVSWGQHILSDMQRANEIKPEVDADAEKHYSRIQAVLHQIDKDATQCDQQSSKCTPEEKNKLAALKAGGEKEAVEAQNSLAMANDVTEYVRGIVQNIAKHSDVTVPIHLYFVWDDDPNAFALPGGFVVVNSGLIYSPGNLNDPTVRPENRFPSFGAEDESEFAGVLAHELSHVAARHARKLENKAELAGILEQGAILAAIFMTGGIATLGEYYLIQYGFFGLDLVLGLSLLGVSRKYEAEADQLGVQYMWNAGYNPTGFVRMFDLMASKFGGIRGGSFFRTHPPFYDRIRSTYVEFSELPPKENLITDTDRFHKVVDELKQLEQNRTKQLIEEKYESPTLGEPLPKCEK